MRMLWRTHSVLHDLGWFGSSRYVLSGCYSATLKQQAGCCAHSSVCVSEGHACVVCVRRQHRVQLPRPVVEFELWCAW